MHIRPAFVLVGMLGCSLALAGCRNSETDRNIRSGGPGPMLSSGQGKTMQPAPMAGTYTPTRTMTDPAMQPTRYTSTTAMPADPMVRMPAPPTTPQPSYDPMTPAVPTTVARPVTPATPALTPARTPTAPVTPVSTGTMEPSPSSTWRTTETPPRPTMTPTVTEPAPSRIEGTMTGPAVPAVPMPRNTEVHEVPAHSQPIDVPRVEMPPPSGPSVQPPPEPWVVPDSK